MIAYHRPQAKLNAKETNVTTNLRVQILIFTLVLVVLGIVSESVAASNSGGNVQFRHVDIGAVAPQETIKNPIKLLTDVDFAPFSFENPDKTVSGLAVDLAVAACAELKLTCQVIAKPFAELLPALKNHEGDAIITGIRLSSDILKIASATRPYYFSSARFITRTGMTFTQPDARALAGRRIGYVKGTSHAAFLGKYYERSALTPFNDESALLESLRTATIDAAFTDSLHASFWLKGTNAQKCCINLGESFIDRETFSRSMSLVISNDQPNLREAFDYALDRLQEKSTTAKIFQRYIPDSLF
jgi:polar amino acid transport system substrate-binding protein